ncbi:hypothetical protein [Crossiella sp. NPDC003009]
MITYDCLYRAIVTVAKGEPEGRDQPYGPFARDGQPVGLLGKALAWAGAVDLSEEDSPCVNSVELLDMKATVMAELVVQVLDAGRTYSEAQVSAWTTFELMRRCEQHAEPSAVPGPRRPDIAYQRHRSDRGVHAEAGAA